MPADLAYLYDLQNKLHDSVGYTPKGGLQERIETGRIIVIEENGWPAGFINYTHRKDRRTHISQLAVDPGIWRTQAGTDVMTRILHDARNAGMRRVTLRTALDLPANEFWPMVGFQEMGCEQGRRRILVCWEHDLHVPTPIRLNVYDIPTCDESIPNHSSTIAATAASQIATTGLRCSHG